MVRQHRLTIGPRQLRSLSDIEPTRGVEVCTGLQEFPPGEREPWALLDPTTHRDSRYSYGRELRAPQALRDALAHQAKKVPEAYADPQVHQGPEAKQAPGAPRDHKAPKAKKRQGTKPVPSHRTTEHCKMQRDHRASKAQPEREAEQA